VFGKVGTDTGPFTRKLVIKNFGKGTLVGVVDLSGLSPPLSGSAPGSFTLAHRQKAEVVVHFAPTSPARYTGAVAISSSDPNAPFVSVAVIGVAKPGRLRAPKSLTFGEVATGKTRKQTLTIENIGIGVLHGNVDGGGLASGPFSIVAGSGDFTLEYGAKLKIVAQFAPAVSGSAGAVLTVTSDDPARLSTSIKLDGRGK